MIRLGGDIRWIGWDFNSEIAASQYDLVASFGGDKNAKFPRPGTGASEPDETAGQLFAPSIAEFNVGAWMSAINGNS